MGATIGLIMSAVAMVGCGADSPVGSVVSAEESPKVARGRYLVAIMGCNDCHTPLKMTPNGPEPDMDRYLSGHPEQIGAVPPAKLQAPYAWAALGTNTAF